jgi:hypothetical protein
MKANEEWRNDPERRAAVAAQIRQRQEVFEEAFEHVKEANRLLRSLGYVTDDPILARSQGEVIRAHQRLSSDRDWIMDEPNETYIGNRAAFGSPTGYVETT